MQLCLVRPNVAVGARSRHRTRGKQTLSPRAASAAVLLASVAAWPCHAAGSLLEDAGVGTLLTLDARDVDAAAAIVRECKARLHAELEAEPGALRSVLLTPTAEAPERVRLMRQWRSVRDLDKHAELPHVRSMMDFVKPLLNGTLDEASRLEKFAPTRHFTVPRRGVAQDVGGFGILVTIRADDVSAAERIVSEAVAHCRRKLEEEEGATFCSVLRPEVAGDLHEIRMIQQWFTKQDYENHKEAPHLDLFIQSISNFVVRGKKAPTPLEVEEFERVDAFESGRRASSTSGHTDEL